MNTEVVGGRKRRGKEEDIAGLRSSADTPYNDVEWEK